MNRGNFFKLDCHMPAASTKTEQPAAPISVEHHFSNVDAAHDPNILLAWLSPKVSHNTAEAWKGPLPGPKGAALSL
jgi:hypothetical protein